jgi:serine protease inhibitor
MRTNLAVAILLVCAAALTMMPARATSPIPPPIADADNAFGINLFKAVAKTSPTANVVVSPVSAAMDLAMALNGAAGETQTQMSNALALKGWTIAQVNDGNAYLIDALQGSGLGGTLSIANSLWTDKKRVKLRDDFLARTRESYRAEVSALDFASPEAPGTINGWVDKETRGKIKTIVDQLSAQDVLLLVNAVYFKGQWTVKFDKAKTTEKDFTTGSGKVKRVPLMSQSGEYEYFETPEFQAISLPYKDIPAHMIVFLPAKTSSLAAFEHGLTIGKWDQWTGRTTASAFGRGREGHLELPRFTTQAREVLNKPLIGLGMARAFSPGSAQFGGMYSPAGGQNVYIGEVLQKTFLKVDEEGSEAAAVTGITMRTTAMRPGPGPFTMVVDRPFACAIVEDVTHAVLFFGAISDP